MKLIIEDDNGEVKSQIEIKSMSDVLFIPIRDLGEERKNNIYAHLDMIDLPKISQVISFLATYMHEKVINTIKQSE